MKYRVKITDAKTGKHVGYVQNGDTSEKHEHTREAADKVADYMNSILGDIAKYETEGFEVAA